MFALFFNLYNSMFNGYWTEYTSQQIVLYFRDFGNVLVNFLTSIFGDVQYTTFGTDIADYVFMVPSFILAMITCIGIVVMAVKGIKRAFGIFFMGIRR